MLCSTCVTYLHQQLQKVSAIGWSSRCRILALSLTLSIYISIYVYLSFIHSLQVLPSIKSKKNLGKKLISMENHKPFHTHVHTHTITTQKDIVSHFSHFSRKKNSVNFYWFLSAWENVKTFQITICVVVINNTCNQNLYNAHIKWIEMKSWQ